MLSFANPAALALALALAPVALLYFLRMRWRRVEVGSLFLWRGLGERTEGGRSLRLRSVLLLALQAAAVLLAAGAAAGPSLVRRELRRPGTVFLVDRSASMAVEDELGGSGSLVSRVEKAAELARGELAALDPDEPSMAFACDFELTPLGSPGTDRRASLAALSSLRASSGGFDEAAVADALAAWLAGRPEPWRAVLVTDGGLDSGGERIAAAFGGNLRAAAVGRSGETVGVTGLRVEASEGGSEARFSVWNGCGAAASFAASLERGGVAIASGRLSAPPGWSRSALRLPGPPAEGAYVLRPASGRGEGGLPGGTPGSSCYLALHAPRAMTALLAGRRNPFLEAALAREGISCGFVAALPERLPDPAPDLVVADGVPVPAGLEANLLVFGRPPPDAPLVVSGRADGRLEAADAAHRLARYVDWEGVAVEGALTYELLDRGPSGGGAGARAVARVAGGGVRAGAGGAIVASWERDGYKAVACGVDLARSELGLSEAFPVFALNVLEWVFPRVDARSAYTLEVGRGAVRAEPPSFSVPGGRVEALRSGSLVRLTAREAGLAAWKRGEARGFVAANVPAGELDVAPRLLALGDGAAALGASYAEESAPLGNWCLAACIACLAAEWALWRKPRLRREAAPRGKR